MGSFSKEAVQSVECLCVRIRVGYGEHFLRFLAVLSKEKELERGTIIECSPYFSKEKELERGTIIECSPYFSKGREA